MKRKSDIRLVTNFAKSKLGIDGGFCILITVPEGFGVADGIIKSNLND